VVRNKGYYCIVLLSGLIASEGELVRTATDWKNKRKTASITDAVFASLFLAVKIFVTPYHEMEMSCRSAMNFTFGLPSLDGGSPNV
jgi:type VI protein secretion system component VasK